MVMIAERPTRLCSHPGCGVETLTLYCAEHAKTHKTPRGAWQHLYNSRAWRKRTRPHILNRDPICKDPFKIGCHKPSTEADHKKDHKGDVKLFFDLSNLQGLCHSCHSRKTMDTNGVIQ
jgi:5-methylcytosine-specific restriction protein A